MCDPRWIHRERIETGAMRGTIVLAFATEATARRVLDAQQSVLGESVTFDRYENARS